MGFAEIMKEYRSLFDKELEHFLSLQVKKVSEPFIKECYEIIKSYTLSGGKRLRPIALMLAYEAFSGDKSKRILLPAICIELHHTYSLILDDVMDEDDYRRGMPTVYLKMKSHYLKNFAEQTYNGSLFSLKSSRFAVSFAVMLSNITNILSKKALILSDFPVEKKAMANKMLELADEKIYHGQMIDILMEQFPNVSEQLYMDMIKLKTAEIFGISFGLGSLFGGAGQIQVQLMKEFGIASALSFQIQDDIIDISGNKGHEKGSDIKKGKKTLLTVKALEKADITQKKIILDILGKADASEQGISAVISIMHKTGAVDYCRRLAMKKNNEAKEILNKIEANGYYKKVFSELNDFMLLRDY